MCSFLRWAAKHSCIPFIAAATLCCSTAAASTLVAAAALSGVPSVENAQEGFPGVLPIGLFQTAFSDTVPAGQAKPVPSDTLQAEELHRIWTIEELDNVLETAAGNRAEGGTSWQRRKNSRVAMLCALLVPGLGQMYNEKPLKAALVLGAETFYVGNVLLNYRNAERETKMRDLYVYGSSEWSEHDAWVTEYKERMIDWVWWSAGALLVVILDAYIDAHLHDMNFEFEGKAFDNGGGVAIVVSF